MTGLIPYKELVASEEALHSAYERHHVMAQGTALKARLGQTHHTEQLRLLDSTALESTLAGNPWFEANYPGVMHVKLHTETPPKQEDVNALYAELHSMVGDAVDRAKASGKQLLILAGEYHSDRNSLLLEHMVLDIAHKAGVDTMINESDEPKEFITQDNLLFWQEQGLTQPPQSDGFLTNDYFWDISPFDNYVLGDPVSTESEEWNLSWPQESVYREMHMVKTITNEVEGSAVGIFGANHIKGLIEGIKDHPKGDQFEILMLNLSQSVAIPNRKAMELDEYNHSRSQYNHEKVPRLTVPGKEMAPAVAWDMASEAAAYFERKQLGIPDDGHVANAAQPQPDMITARGR